MLTTGFPRPPETLPPEPTLDPDDWEGLRHLGHRMVDDMLASLRTIRDQPVHRPVPPDVAETFRTPAPRGPQAPEAIYEEFRRTILPYPHGNIHPRFWGWVVGTGTPLGMLAEMLAAGLNSNSGFGDHSVMYVERQVLDWLKEALGFPAPASGILTSGCSVANLAGLTIARNAGAGWDVRARGVQGAPATLRVYGSAETHSSNLRALEVMGLGRDAFRAIPADVEHKVVVPELARAIRADRAAGDRPVCVIGNAGTVNVGAFDDLEALADLCAAERLWLHVDGAFGALAALAPSLRPRVAGLARADSVAFDLHKWLHVPYDAGALLVRDAERHHETFRMSGAYLASFSSTLATGPVNFMEHGVQMSRGFRALKAWMTIKEHGLDRLGRTIAHNVEQARYLACRVGSEPELELLAPVPLNIVNFRFAPKGLAAERLDDVNRELLTRLHASGVAAPSHTMLDGRFSLRVAITNHRSRFVDFDLLVDTVLELGRAQVGAGREW
jgi:glutamate/tyrosine decarboxylase-like PLP-dependent enzyme